MVGWQKSVFYVYPVGVYFLHGEELLLEGNDTTVDPVKSAEHF